MRITPMLLVCVFNVSTVCTFAQGFDPGCKLPFEAIKTEGLEIDQACSIDGNAEDDTGKKLESNAKNNFCVKGTPTPVTYNTFKRLQSAADEKDKLRAALKESRKILARIL